MLVNKSVIVNGNFRDYPKEDREFVTYKTGIPGGPGPDSIQTPRVYFSVQLITICAVVKSKCAVEKGYVPIARFCAVVYALDTGSGRESMLDKLHIHDLSIIILLRFLGPLNLDEGRCGSLMVI